ncbi:MAG: class I SAM-dependent methyltransferase [Lachnospiraceae bacterium]|nr:class I SAM-dependent methyltransferase [Lachnospiraceae bacterium]
MNIQWNSKNYKEQFSFVPQYGEAVINLITREKGCRVVDLGCGNGTLTKKLSDAGYDVIGIDDSAEMIALASSEYPEIAFRKENALSFELQEKADVIFSNAVFHWIDREKQEELARNLSRQLKLSGELVCEFGGYGCAEAVHSTLEACFRERNIAYPRTFYFPTIGEHAPILEKYGLQIEYAVLFDRPTPQQADDGLIEWINMFVKKPFENMDWNVRNEILNDTKSRLKEKLFIDGKWYIDYVRIRIRARKVREM